MWEEFRMKKAGAIFLSLLLPFSWLSAFPSAAAEPVIRQPIVRYDFSDPDHLGKDRMGRFDLVDVGNVAQGSKSNAVKSAVFNGTSALCAVPVAGRDPTDGLETLTITLWGKRSAVQSPHTFMLGTGVAYSATGLGMGFYDGNDAFIVPLGGVQDGAYAANYRFPNETQKYASSFGWNFYCLSLTQKGGSFFINGEEFPLQNVGDKGLLLENLGQTLTLGGIYNNDRTVFYNGFQGELADVRIYDTALSAQEIATLYADGAGAAEVMVPEGQVYVTGASDIDDPDLTVSKTDTPTQILAVLDAYPIAYQTSDGKNHTDGRAVWTALDDTHADYLQATGVFYHPAVSNPKGVTVTAKLYYGQSRTIQIAALFTDHMVLQREQKVRIFGYGGSAEDTLTVSFAGQTAEAVLDGGQWEVWLEPMPASAQPRDLTVAYTKAGKTSPDQTIVLEDVLVGEVWLASGQSNMAYTINEMKGTDTDFLKDYSAIDNWQLLRFYNQPYGESSTPSVYYTPVTEWQTPGSMEEVGGYSGFALAYAAQLQKALGENIPVGMITSAVGGSCIEEWLDRETMNRLPSHAASMGKVDSRFYNAMIHHMAGYTIKGILWDQGEANALWPEDYQDQFAAYAALYRRLFRNDALPIITMQLPQYSEPLFVAFRDTQWKLMEQLDNVWAICGIDLGNPDNIHPTDKYPFAGRAAGAALEKIYQLPAANGKPYGLSPSIAAIEKTAEGWRLTISGAKTLIAEGRIHGFQVWDGQNWRDAEAIIQGGSILVTADAVKPTKIAYLQKATFAEQGFVYNEYGLPLAPMAERQLSTEDIPDSSDVVAPDVPVQTGGPLSLAAGFLALLAGGTAAVLLLAKKRRV